MHMKGLPAWQYPLALPACAIERNLFPPRRISIFVKLEDEGSQSFCSAESRESSQSGHCHVSFSKRVREKSRLHFRPRARLHAHCAEPMTPEEAVVTRPERQLASGNLDEQSKDALGHFWARWLMAIELLRIATHRRPQQEPAKTPSPTRFSRPPLR